MPTITKRRAPVSGRRAPSVSLKKYEDLEARLARAKTATKATQTRNESLLFSIGGPALVAYGEKQGWKLPDVDGIDPMLTIGVGLLFAGDMFGGSAAMKRNIAQAAEGCIASGIQRAIARDSIRIAKSPPQLAASTPKQSTQGYDDSELAG